MPALIHIDGQKIPREERIGPSVLVMAPTRELALQIDREVNKYSYKNIKAYVSYEFVVIIYTFAYVTVFAFMEEAVEGSR